jgi:myo-inositol-hexaphosphate 3-phosphohydrolase
VAKRLRRLQIRGQTEDVSVDTRGYIHIIDKNWGMWVLRYSGPISRRQRAGDFIDSARVGRGST